MDTKTIIAICVAFALGLSIGYSVKNRTNAVDAIGAMPPRSSTAMELPEGHPSIGEAGSQSPSMANAANAAMEAGTTTEGESYVIAGLSALEVGEYAKAIPYLAKASVEIQSPQLRILQAIAAEGAGNARAADAFLKTDSEVEMLRAIGKEALMEHNEIKIAGPAYQIYLRHRPNTENRPMMENAVRIWKEGKTGL